MPLIGACCELSWCEPVEARVRPVGVVVDPPFFDDIASLVEVGEEGSLRHVTQSAVEAFHEAILHRFAGRNVVPFKIMLLLPGYPNTERDDRQPRKASFSTATYLPHVVMLSLFGIAAVGCGFAGYASGLDPLRTRLPVFITAFLVCAVICNT